jgi:hypothetical protein
MRANGWRYPLVGGTRQRQFAGTNFKPRKLLENAQTPTSRVHAVLGGFCSSSIQRSPYQHNNLLLFIFLSAENVCKGFANPFVSVACFDYQDLGLKHFQTILSLEQPQSPLLIQSDLLRLARAFCLLDPCHQKTAPINLRLHLPYPTTPRV